MAIAAWILNGGTSHFKVIGMALGIRSTISALYTGWHAVSGCRPAIKPWPDPSPRRLWPGLFILA
jgi:hypothetical protein